MSAGVEIYQDVYSYIKRMRTNESNMYNYIPYDHEGVAFELEAPIALGIFLSPCASCSRSAGLK